MFNWKYNQTEPKNQNPIDIKTWIGSENDIFGSDFVFADYCDCAPDRVYNCDQTSEYPHSAPLAYFEEDEYMTECQSLFVPLPIIPTEINIQKNEQKLQLGLTFPDS